MMAAETLSTTSPLRAANDFQTGCVVRQLNPRLVETRDRGDQTEPQPIARGAAAALEPVKATEYVLVLVERNSRTIVGDRNHRAIVAPV